MCAAQREFTCTSVLTQSGGGRPFVCIFPACTQKRPTLQAWRYVCAGDGGRAEAKLRLRSKRSDSCSPVLNREGTSRTLYVLRINRIISKIPATSQVLTE